MAHPEGSLTPQDSVHTPTGTPDDGASSTSKRVWFPPKADDFEITPEAAMYAGRR
jgi:hypothetical protein